MNNICYKIIILLAVLLIFYTSVQQLIKIFQNYYYKFRFCKLLEYKPYNHCDVSKRSQQFYHGNLECTRVNDAIIFSFIPIIHL